MYLLPEQNQKLERQRKEINCSKSQYMAMLLENDGGVFLEVAKKKIQPAPLSEDYRSLVRELSLIGSNLNQCTQRLNALARGSSNLSDNNIVLLERYAQKSLEAAEQLAPLLKELGNELRKGI